MPVPAGDRPAGGRPVGDYLGCYGRVPLGGPPPRISCVTAPLGQRPSWSDPGVHLVQWAVPGAARVPSPSQRERLLLTGVVRGPVTPAWAGRLARVLKQGRHAELARVPGALAGALVADHRVFLFRSATSEEALHYRCSRDLVRFSTDPTDLLDGPGEAGREEIWRACRGDAVFVYPGIARVPPGTVVTVGRGSVTTAAYDPVTPLELPPRTTMAEFAEAARPLVTEAVRPYAGTGRTGVLLSDGLGSAAVLAALVECGADAVAYHYATRDPLADESAYARAVCDHLGVPLMLVPTEHGSGYLDERWQFPHPYNRPAYRWLEQMAERVAKDGITFLARGREGDRIFGPARYGLHDVLTGDLPAREKATLCRGLLTSRWELPRILRSASPRTSLLDDLVPAGGAARPADFLTPLPGAPADAADADHTPQEHCANLTVWRPRGIQLCNPLGSKGLRRLAARLPGAYRLLPHQGRLITQPVLRLMLAGRFPAAVWRRHGRLWLGSPHKDYALRHPDVFAALLGRPGAHLVRMGVVDPRRLAHVLAEPARLRLNAETLIGAAMTELFLRSDARRTPAARRGTPPCP
ncbi:asparagine synthase-related protein [Streptomyces sp. NPDC008001]|uniref:asparagine synthase-related protein n=1 Tax=Streptomyces sp. NPDC008001 TaxID=3364804 RepID=UPI0036E0B14D